ncbi:hypothetical protein JOB18_011425 [Solea senegalensis]|uniref:Uncharacterized protein n=1 Tax=Solea senegalensis TaxID=28829 RepID=A0AAV6PKK9_SOLSE|nr:hypothetical protein JOB18_011425 [Solea senegalensis]
MASPRCLHSARLPRYKGSSNEAPSCCTEETVGPLGKQNDVEQRRTRRITAPAPRRRRVSFSTDAALYYLCSASADEFGCLRYQNLILMICALSNETETRVNVAKKATTAFLIFVFARDENVKMYISGYLNYHETKATVKVASPEAGDKQRLKEPYPQCVKLSPKCHLVEMLHRSWLTDSVSCQTSAFKQLTAALVAPSASQLSRSTALTHIYTHTHTLSEQAQPSAVSRVRRSGFSGGIPSAYSPRDGSDICIDYRCMMSSISRQA